MHSKQARASLYRVEELLLEIIETRFAACWREAVGGDAERTEFNRGWTAAWDDAQSSLSNIVANHLEGLAIKEAAGDSR